jgi:hypothetical protein
MGEASAFALFVVKVSQLNRLRVPAIELSLGPSDGRLILGCTVKAKLVFDPKLLR